jgi:hypothetical protein
MHRTHLCRLLPLPWLFAAVRVEPLPRELRARWEHRKELAALWKGLIRRGLITGSVADGLEPRLHLVHAAAAWLLSRAGIATSINRAYERLYPGAWRRLGIPDGIATDQRSGLPG